MKQIVPNNLKDPLNATFSASPHENYFSLYAYFILLQKNKYDVGSGEQFDDLVGLIEHFRSYPMIENSGDVLRLLQPVSGTCLRAQDINRKVKVHD